MIGDSCFAGSPKGAYYWSDRIPETLGRGGFLIHPYVDGLGRQFNLLEHDEPVTYDAGHLAVWDAGDWEALGDLIEWSRSALPTSVERPPGVDASTSSSTTPTSGAWSNSSNFSPKGSNT